MLEQESILGRCRMRRWAKLLSGGALISGGLCWCLSPTLKENSNKWTILTVFLMGSTGVSLARSATENAHLRNKARNTPELISSRIAKLDLTGRDQLRESDLFLLINVVHKMETLAVRLDSNEEKCDSCVDMLEKFYTTLLTCIGSINAAEQSLPRIFGVIEKVSKDYKVEHGYPNAVTRYGEVIPPRFEEVTNKMLGDLKYVGTHVQGLIAKEWPIELHNIFNLSDECISDFLLSADISEEHRKAVGRIVQALLVLFGKVLLQMKNEFRPRVRRVAAPFFKCEKERKLIGVLEKLLFYYRVKEQVKFDAGNATLPFTDYFSNASNQCGFQSTTSRNMWLNLIASRSV